MTNRKVLIVGKEKTYFQLEWDNLKMKKIITKAHQNNLNQGVVSIIRNLSSLLKTLQKWMNNVEKICPWLLIIKKSKKPPLIKVSDFKKKKR